MTKETAEEEVEEGEKKTESLSRHVTPHHHGRTHRGEFDSHPSSRFSG